MGDLTNKLISQTFDGLIKTIDEQPIDGILKGLQDGVGNNLPMQASTAGVKFTANLDVDHVSYDTTAAHVVTTGEIAWNADDQTFDMGLLNGVALQAGQELHFYGKATEAIANGDAVQFAGAQGSHILFKKAVQAEIAANPEYFIGVATQAFATNDFGYVTSFGKVRGINTGAYLVGTILWFDAEGVTPGALTSTEPSNGNVKIQVAAVTDSGPNGSIMVRPVHVRNIAEIGDVEVTGVTDGQVLSYESATGLWKNTTPSGGGSATNSFMDAYKPANMNGWDSTAYFFTSRPVHGNLGWNNLNDQQPGSIQIGWLFVEPGKPISEICLPLRRVTTNITYEFGIYDMWTNGSPKNQIVSESISVLAADNVAGNQYKVHTLTTPFVPTLGAYYFAVRCTNSNTPLEFDNTIAAMSRSDVSLNVVNISADGYSVSNMYQSGVIQTNIGGPLPATFDENQTYFEREEQLILLFR